MTKTIDIKTGEVEDVLDQNAVTVLKDGDKVVANKADIDSFLQVRQEFIQKVNAICIEGKDYHIIQGRKSLAKGGAEKIASIFQWNASFEADKESLAMLGDTPGLVAFVCRLTHGDNFIGEGRGSALLSKNQNDANKTLKMAQKSAFIDAVLRSSGLSDFFTQDLENMKASDIGRPSKQEEEADDFMADAGEPPYQEEVNDHKDDKIYKCESCGDKVSTKVMSYSSEKYGKVLCFECQKK